MSIVKTIAKHIYLMPIVVLLGTLSFHSYTICFVTDLLLKYSMKDIYSLISKQELAIYDIFKKGYKYLQFDCSSLDLYMIKSDSFHNKLFRTVGIVTRDGRSSCDAIYGSVALPLSMTNNHGNVIDVKDLNLFVSSNRNERDNEFVFFRRYDEGGLYVIVNDGFIHEIIDLLCNDCLAIQIDYAGKQSGAGDNALLRSDGKPFISRVSPLGFVTLSLAPNPGFLIFAEHLLMTFVYPILFLLGIIISLIWFYARRQDFPPIERIRQGINNNEFRPYYQPIFHTQNGKMSGMEVLTRWHVNGEILSPISFMPLIEADLNTLRGFTFKMMQDVFDEMEKTILYQSDSVWISINITPTLLTDKQFRHFVTTQAKKFKHFHFEITELEEFSDYSQARHAITELTKFGYKFKIDDFGIGFSGLARVRELNLDTVKLDKYFVQTIGQSPEADAFCVSIIDMCKKNKYYIIAEGVETETQLQLLKEYGVDMTQGYYHSKPVMLSELLLLSHCDMSQGIDAARVDAR